MNAWTAFAQAARPDTPAVVELNLWLQDWAGRLDFRLMDARRCLPPHLVLALGNRGVLGMQVAEEQGGLLGLSTFELLRVQRQLGAIDLTLAFFVGLNNGLGIRPIPALRFSRRESPLPATTGDWPDARRLRLDRAGGGFQPAEHGGNGTAPGRTLASGRAQVLVWLCRLGRGNLCVCAASGRAGARLRVYRLLPGRRPTGPAPGQRGADPRSQGYGAEPGAFRSRRGPCGTGAGQSVRRDGGRQRHHGFRAPGYCRHLRRRLVALCAIDDSLQPRRSLGSQRLWDHEHTQTLVGGAVCAATALGGWVDDLATGLDQGQPVPPAEVLAAVKWLASELLGEVSDSALQMLGARGYCDNNPIGQLWRDARITRLFEGPSQTLAAFIGQRVLEQPAVIGHIWRSCPTVNWPSSAWKPG